MMTFCLLLLLLGYIAATAPNDTLLVLGSVDTACTACPEGYYGSDPLRLVCSAGIAGYYYLGATTSATPTNVTSQRGGICPTGHYCPALCSLPQACPVGTYQPTLGGTEASQCLQCNSNTYQYREGSASCYQCSSSSTSGIGAELCSCVGQNRAFQPLDGFCICKPGYQFVDSNLQVSSENDGSYDCQPIVLTRCLQTEVRLFDGSCVTSAGSYCDRFCGSDGGIVSQTSGTCVCNTITTVAEVCPSSCQDSTTTVKCGSDGDLVAYDPITRVSTALSQGELSTQSQGALDCSTPGSNVYSMSTESGKFEGIFGPGRALSNLITQRRLMSSSSSRSSSSSGSSSYDHRHDRLLPHSFLVGAFDFSDYYVDAAELPRNSTSIDPNDPNHNSIYRKKHGGIVGSRRLANSSYPVLPNPIVSLKTGDSVIFDISKQNYPKYVKDSLLNTNPDFDYSKFRELEFNAATNLEFTTFSFTFNTAGTYVFQLSSSTSSVTIFKVLDTNVARSVSSYFVESSNANLVVVGVKSDTNYAVSPDWNLVVGLLLGILVLVLMMLGFLYYFRRRAWSYHAVIDTSYRRKNKKVAEDTEPGGGLGLGAMLFGNNKNNKNNNKVHVADDTDEDKRIEDKPAAVPNIVSSTDLEGAAFKDHAESELDDEMLLPELAKHMQSHHDEIDKQLKDQNELMNSLQELLKKEVDELKALLNATMSELSSGSSEAQQKKLVVLLNQLKSDASGRVLYELDVDNDSKRIIASITQVHKHLINDCENIATHIVDELTQDAIALSERDQQIADIHSPMLGTLSSSLEDIRVMTLDKLLSLLSIEKRRSKAADESFDHGVRNLRDVVFPSTVLDALKNSKDADIHTDASTDDVIAVLRSFSDNIPKCVLYLHSTESELVQGLARTIERGNPSLVEREQLIAKQSFNSFLGDLFEALNVLLSAVNQRLEPVGKSVENGKVYREQLIIAIDNALRGLVTSPSTAAAAGGAAGVVPAGLDSDAMQQLLEPLLAALKDVGSLNLVAPSTGIVAPSTGIVAERSTDRDRDNVVESADQMKTAAKEEDDSLKDRQDTNEKKGDMYETDMMDESDMMDDNDMMDESDMMEDALNISDSAENKSDDAKKTTGTKEQRAAEEGKQLLPIIAEDELLQSDDDDGGDGDEDQDEDQDEHKDQREDVSVTRHSSVASVDPAPPAPNHVDEEVMESVLNNDILSNTQKEIILDSAENDVKIMDNIIELERKKQEEALQQVANIGMIISEDEDDVNKQRLKFEEEQRALEAALLQARKEAELEQQQLLMSSSNKEAEEEEDMTKESRVKCLLDSRLAALYRHWSSHSRLSYKELHLRYQLDRIKVQLTRYDPTSRTSSEAVESVLSDLSADEDRETNKLSRTLSTLLADGELREQVIRSKMLADVKAVNVAEETERLQKQYTDSFSVLKTRLQGGGGVVTEYCKLAGSLKLAELQAKRGQLDDGPYDELLKAASLEIETSETTVESMLEEDLRITFAEEMQLFEILEHASAWDGRRNERATQSQLQLRQLEGLRVNASITNKLAVVEFELRSEYEQIRTSNQLLKQDADESAVAMAMSQLEEDKKRDELQLKAKLQDKLSKVLEVERGRQDSTVVNYEKERAVAIEQICYREVLLSIEMNRSIRGIKGDIRSALADKKTVMLERLQNDARISEAVRQMKRDELDAELTREEIELQVAYDSFQEGYSICERYLSEVTQSLEPSTAYVEQLVNEHNVRLSYLMEESVHLDSRRKTLKKKAVALKYMSFESSRLKSLGRSSEDINLFQDDINAHLQHSINHIMEATQAELRHMKRLFQKQLMDQLEIHKSYEQALGRFVESYSQEKATMGETYSNDRQYLLDHADQNRGGTVPATVDNDKALFELEHKYTAGLIKAEMKYSDNLYECFKTVMLKILSEQAAEEELWYLRQRLNQEGEALDEVSSSSSSCRSSSSSSSSRIIIIISSSTSRSCCIVLLLLLSCIVSFL